MDIDNALDTPRDAAHTTPTAPTAPTVPIAGSGAEMDVESGENETIQVRSVEVPRWLSTPEHLLGGDKGRARALEEEYECTISTSGQGSGVRDPKVPGYHLPYLRVTFTGSDVRQLGRIRREIEDLLIDYVIQNSPPPKEAVNPPPSLGRLMYALGMSASSASPNTKDRRPDRTVLCRSHFPAFPHTRRGKSGQQSAKKVWMNILELPQDTSTGEYHGKFLAGHNFRNYYKNHLNCRVDIYGVWGDMDELMCAPYVLISSPEKVNVDKCIMYVEHRIRDQEDQKGVSRSGGRRVLRGESRHSADM